MSGKARTCSFCGELKVGANYNGKFYCNKHWQRMYYRGTPYPKEYESRCKFEKVDDYYKMITTKGDVILIDAEDYDMVKQHSWCISKTGYPVTNTGRGKVVKLQRMLLDVKNPKLVVDHINGDPFDNRKMNLRICNNKENARNCKLSKNNRSGYVGVSQTLKGRWRARIMINRKEKCLGTFATMEEAIKARRDAEDKYFGEFAPHKNIDYFAQFMNPPQTEVEK